MEIFPNGKSNGADALMKKMAQLLNKYNTKVNFPFDFAEVSDENDYNYPADKIGGFVQIKHLLDIPQEIYVNINDAKEIGIFVLKLLTNS